MSERERERERVLGCVGDSAFVRAWACLRACMVRASACECARACVRSCVHDVQANCAGLADAAAAAAAKDAAPSPAAAAGDLGRLHSALINHFLADARTVRARVCVERALLRT